MSLNREQQVLADHIKSLFDLLPVISELEKQVRDNPTNLTIMANTTFVVKKCKDIMESIEKKLNTLESKTAEQASIVLATIEEHKWKTEYCTISDNSEFYLKHPDKPCPEEPEKHVEYIQFVKKLAEEAPEVLRPHYKDFTTKISEVMRAGGEIPFGLDKLKIKGMIFKLRMTSKQEL